MLDNAGNSRYSISQLISGNTHAKIKVGLSEIKGEINSIDTNTFYVDQAFTDGDDEPGQSPFCIGCQNQDSCPWVSASDCVTAETDAWFGHLFIDPHLD